MKPTAAQRDEPTVSGRRGLNLPMETRENPEFRSRVIDPTQEVDLIRNTSAEKKRKSSG